MASETAMEPKSAQRGPPNPKRPPTASDGPGAHQNGRSWVEAGPRGPKKPPRGPQEGQKKRPNSSMFQKMLLEDVDLFGLPTARNGPRSPKDRPKIAQEASKMAP
eukprot:2990745-Pyramimonas_sp.AAC.1